MVYDDTIEEIPLFFVRYWRDSNRQLHGNVLTRTTIINLDKWSEPEEHYFDGVPVIEYIENEERQGAFESVKTLIDALDKAVSEKANDVDYFADAYMKLLGVSLDDSKLEKLREDRIINIEDTGTNTVDVAFLEKPNADTTQENLIDRLIDLIYQMSMVTNVSDDTLVYITTNYTKSQRKWKASISGMRAARASVSRRRARG